MRGLQLIERQGRVIHRRREPAHFVQHLQGRERVALGEVAADKGENDVDGGERELLKVNPLAGRCLKQLHLVLLEDGAAVAHALAELEEVAAGEVVDKGEDYDATLEGELDVLQLCLHALQDRDPPRAVLGILLDQHLEKRRVLAPALLARRVHDHRHRRSRQHVVDLAAPDRQVQHPHAVAPATDERQLHLLQVARHQLLRRDINQVEPDPAQREADRQHPCGPDPHAPARCPLLVLVLVLALSHRV
mmetsp:Transcript_40178/g.95375  ORF Transcript_40178/g.95375 Transcript_40178/m.95375 type:complete len:248 (-) Transcript_40178:85-828(-)